MIRIAHIKLGLTLSTVLLLSVAAAQTAALPPGQTSLGDYARKVRKDPATPKATPKVFDNDNLPKGDKLSIVGQPAPPAAAAPATTGEKSTAPSDNKNAAEAKPKESTEDEQAKKEALWKEWQGKLTEQKNQIDLAARELDVLQREYQLRAAAMYADAGNRIRNEAQWDKQDADYKQKIADKQKALDDARQKLTDMQEEARRAGVPSSMTE